LGHLDSSIHVQLLRVKVYGDTHDARELYGRKTYTTNSTRVAYH
jgi:hypothetical protein